MKKLFFILINLASFAVNAQTKDSAFSAIAGQPYFINTAGQITQLEKSLAKLDQTKKGRMTPTLIIDGEHASIKIPSPDTVRLVLISSTDFGAIDQSMVFHF